MIRWLLASLAMLSPLAFATPSLAQPALACPAAPDLGRYSVDRQAIEYGRLVDYATAAREDRADRARDLADLLLPDMRATASACDPPDSAAAVCLRGRADAFADYLRTALGRERIDDLWAFLVPRAGPVPAADAQERLLGWRFLRWDHQLLFNRVDAPPHISRRRERAFQYLERHRNGRAIMTATAQFVQSRMAGAEATTVCS